MNVTTTDPASIHAPIATTKMSEITTATTTTTAETTIAVPPTPPIAMNISATMPYDNSNSSSSSSNSRVKPPSSLFSSNEQQTLSSFLSEIEAGSSIIAKRNNTNNQQLSSITPSSAIFPSVAGLGLVSPFVSTFRQAAGVHMGRDHSLHSDDNRPSNVAGSLLLPGHSSTSHTTSAAPMANDPVEMLPAQLPASSARLIDPDPSSPDSHSHNSHDHQLLQSMSMSPIENLSSSPAIKDVKPQDTSPATTATTTTTTTTKNKVKGGRSSSGPKVPPKPRHMRKKGELLTEEEKKANHIASEQKRRKNIKAGYAQLVQVVPTLSHNQKSEALILQRTVEYVRYLLMEREILERQIKDLGEC